MKCLIHASSGPWFDSKEDYDYLLNIYPFLKDFGLHLDSGSVYIYINSMDELMTLIERAEHGVCIFDNPPSIEIYDDWRE